ncbi:MAG: hypothetical protein LBM98_07225 [Oscillospiraceae bacterium]|nr:hypothetical protein [Oscillospiraceae bacterium]
MDVGCVRAARGTTPPPAGGTPPKRGIGRGQDGGRTGVGRGYAISPRPTSKFPSWEGWRVAPGWFPRAVRGRNSAISTIGSTTQGFPAPCADVTPSNVPAHCAGTGQGVALSVFAKPPPHLRYVQLLCGEAIQG